MDRELLELAAKAAGIKIDKNGPWVEGRDAWAHATREEWNPFNDDGDALRLAVQLKLDVFFHPSRVEAHTAGGRIPPIHHIARETYGTDPYAATRRAIVRAAAEIGRSMK